jgi:hypothetical protein
VSPLVHSQQVEEEKLCWTEDLLELYTHYWTGDTKWCMDETCIAL